MKVFSITGVCICLLKIQFQKNKIFFYETNNYSSNQNLEKRKVRSQVHMITCVKVRAFLPKSKCVLHVQNNYVSVQHSRQILLNRFQSVLCCIAIYQLVTLSGVRIQHKLLNVQQCAICFYLLIVDIGPSMEGNVDVAYCQQRANQSPTGLFHCHLPFTILGHLSLSQ